MQIDRQLILKLENLARLELSEEERNRLTMDMTNILKMVETMNALDTSGIEPLVHLTDESGKLREDITKNQVTQAAALKNAPAQDGSYFKVPKVL